MSIRVYYEESDGQLQPKLVLLPNYVHSNETDNEFSYIIEGPFERFHQEDFHDDLKTISLSLGVLKLSMLSELMFTIDIQQLQADLAHMSYDPDVVYEADYFIVLVDDLQELLAFDVLEELKYLSK